MFVQRKHKLIARCLVATTLLLFAGSAWIAGRTVAWVRDLPNRIHVDGEALGNAVTESIRSSLHASDPETQLHMIKSLADVATHDVETLVWIRDEYAEDLETLSKSPNTDVATNAATLLSLITEID